MANLSHDDREAIINRVYTHFIANRQPAGSPDCTKSAYHGINHNGHHVSCAIGIFDTGQHLSTGDTVSVRTLYDVLPDALASMFGVSELTDDDVVFLYTVQGEHDMAVYQAASSEHNFESYFIEELDHRLSRMAGEQNLSQPLTENG